MAAKNSMFEPEDTDILQDMYGTDAVSYTHLDVYKRQPPVSLTNGNGIKTGG